MFTIDKTGNLLIRSKNGINTIPFAQLARLLSTRPEEDFTSLIPSRLP
jgi:hypothetical protein